MKRGIEMAGKEEQRRLCPLHLNTGAILPAKIFHSISSASFPKLSFDQIEYHTSASSIYCFTARLAKHDEAAAERE